VRIPHLPPTRSALDAHGPPRARPRRLPLLPLALVLAGASAFADEPDAAALRAIIDAAEPGATPAALSFYPALPQGSEATLNVDEGELAFQETVTLDWKVSGDRYLVLEMKSDNLVGEHARDVIAADPESGALRRWRLLPDGRIARLTGVPLLDHATVEEPIRQPPTQILWQGPIEHRGEATGLEVLALETLHEFEEPVFSGKELSWRLALTREGRVTRREAIRFHHHEFDSSALKQPEEPKKGGLGGLLGRILGRDDADPAPEEQEEDEEDRIYEVPEFNLAFDHPPGTYVKLDPAAINPDASLIFMQQRPRRFLLVIAEDVGQQHGFDSKSLTGISQTMLRAAYADIEIGETEEVEINGVRFRRFFSHGELPNGNRGDWGHLVAVHHGFAYQIVLSAMSRGGGDQDLAEDLATVARGFRLLDPQRIAMGGSVARAEAFDAPHFGIHLDPQAFDGVSWDPAELRAQFPAAAFGTTTPTGAGMVVAAVDLGDLEPGQDALEVALLNSVGLEADPVGAETAAHEQGSATGKRLTVRYRNFGTDFTQQARLLRHGTVACVISGFSAGKDADTLERLDAILDAVRFRLPEEADNAGPDPQQALLLNGIGLHHHTRGDARSALPFYERASSLDPDNPIYAANVLQALEDGGQPGRALERLETALAADPDPDPAAEARRANLLVAVGRGREATELFARLFAEGLRDDERLITYLDLLLGGPEPERAVEAIDAYVERHAVRSLQILRLRARIYSQAGDPERAVELSRELVSAHPGDPHLRLDLVTALVDAEHAEEALELLDQQPFGANQQAAALYQRGRALNLEREFRRAKEAFEGALELAPHDPLVREGLEIASAMLGQGDQQAIREPIDPVSPPPELRDALAANTAETPAGGYASRVLSSTTGIHFRKGEPMRRTEFREVALLTRAGVEEYKQIVFTFDPTYETAFVNRVEVLDPDGEVISRGDVRDYYVSGSNAGPGMPATSERTVTAPVPGLKPGLRLRYEYTIRSKSDRDTLPFERFLFGSLAPAGPRAVFLRGDVEAVRASTSHGDFASGGGGDVRYWLLAEPPKFQFEDFLPDFDEFLPSLHLGPASEDWQQVGRGYLDDLDDRLEPSPAIRDLAARLLDDVDAPSRRIEAILSHVRSELNYQAIAFGTRARIPQPPDRILRNRYGDCKDHSLLAHLLLEAGGIPSSLALVNTAAGVDPELPSLDQFDHMIVFVPGPEGGAFYDCTADHGTFAQRAPNGLEGRKALVLDSAGPRLAEIPVSPPEHNRVRSERRVRLDTSGNAFQIEERVEFDGQQGQWLRGYLAAEAEAELVPALVRLLGSDHRLRIDQAEVEGLDDPATTLAIELEYTISEALDEENGSGRLPGLWETLYFRQGAANPRLAPFELRNGYVFEVDCRWQGEEAPPRPIWKSARGDSPWLDWQLEATDAGKRLQGRIHSRRGIFDASSYDEFRRDQASLLDSLKGRVEAPDAN